MNYEKIKELLEVDFNDIITALKVIDERKLRIYVIDNTYIDLFIVEIESQIKFSLH